MELLRILEGIRTPFFDKLFGSVTYLGDETVFLVLCLLIFWCISKQEGYYLLAAGLGGTVFNQFLKIFCRIPRPWVLDEDFTIVESARARATGYSFPSGHSQNAVGTFGGIALWTGRRLIRIAGVILALIICFSRLYLGVHTPKDVITAALCALVLLLILRPLMKKNDSSVTRIIFIVLSAAALANLLFVTHAEFPADIDPENLAEAVKNAYTLFGCSLAVLVVQEADARWIRFETKAPVPVQILKMILGIALVLALRVGLKLLLKNTPLPAGWADALRYFLIVVFAGSIWPMCFRLMTKSSHR